MYNCLIVDDEPSAHEVLKHYITKNTELKIVGNAFNAIEAKEFLEKKNIDIVFLDIDMPEISGLELLKQYTINARVILTTAYSDFALDGYNLGVIDYLLKPIPFKRFETAIEKVKKSLLVDELNKFIHFKINGINTKFLYSDILYFNSEGNYIKIATERKSYLTLGTLSDLESLFDIHSFIRVHKSFMINSSFLRNSNSKAYILINKVKIPIGRTYKIVVLKFLEK